MASSGYNPSLDKIDAGQFNFGIVVSEWNKDITGELLNGCMETLEAHGVTVDPENIIWVPGSFELPIGAKILASTKKYDAIICLGCIIKGETSHDQYISQSVANGLTQLSILSNIPCLFGVLTTNSKEQAVERTGGNHGHKGKESALSAIQMASIKRHKTNPAKSIGYQ